MLPTPTAQLERFTALLEARFGSALVTVALFGSQAQGRARPESDVDLLLVVEGLPPRRFDRWRLVRPLIHEAGAEFALHVSPILLTPEEAGRIKPYYLGFLEGHRLLAERGDFFEGVLARLRRRLADLGSRRLVDELGDPYWDLKPDYVLGEDVVL